MVKLTSDYVNTTITNFVIFRHTHTMMTWEGVETNQDKKTHLRADPVDNCGPGDECLFEGFKGRDKEQLRLAPANGHQLIAPNSGHRKS